MKLKFILFFLLNSKLFSCNNQYNELEDGVYAEINTSLGKMLIQLNYKETPVTVANFIALSEGTHPDVKQDFKEKKFYNGLIFHRVMDKFMIQGGCPLGNGSGNPGYTFDDEINPNLKHDKAGILSMANSGPATNGSQFFITEVPTPWLDGKHTVFGQVISGIEIQDKISNVKTAIANRPENDVIINSVNIIKIGESANNFDEVSVWINEEPKLEKRRIEIGKEYLASFVYFGNETLSFVFQESGILGNQDRSGEDIVIGFNSKYLIDIATEIEDKNLIQNKLHSAYFLLIVV